MARSAKAGVDPQGERAINSRVAAWFFREALRRHRLGVNEGRHLIVQRGVEPTIIV